MLRRKAMNLVQTVPLQACRAPHMLSLRHLTSKTLHRIRAHIEKWPSSSPTDSISFTGPPNTVHNTKNAVCLCHHPPQNSPTPPPALRLIQQRTAAPHPLQPSPPNPLDLTQAKPRRSALPATQHAMQQTAPHIHLGLISRTLVYQ